MTGWVFFCDKCLGCACAAVVQCSVSAPCLLLPSSGGHRPRTSPACDTASPWSFSLQWRPLGNKFMFRPFGFLCHCQQLTTGGILFLASPCVRGCVIKSVGTVCYKQHVGISPNLQLRWKDELIRFRGERHFVTYLHNAWTYFNATYHNYSLPSQDDAMTFWRSWVQRSKSPITFAAEAYRLTVCHLRPSGWVINP